MSATQCWRFIFGAVLSFIGTIDVPVFEEQGFIRRLLETGRRRRCGTLGHADTSLLR